MRCGRGTRSGGRAHHGDEAADEAEVGEVVGVDGGRGVDLQAVVALARVLEQAVHGVQHLVREQEKPFSGRKRAEVTPGTRGDVSLTHTAPCPPLPCLTPGRGPHARHAAACPVGCPCSRPRPAPPRQAASSSQAKAPSHTDLCPPPSRPRRTDAQWALRNHFNFTANALKVEVGL